jgi:His-Xaa-Ser system protein HxsD
MENELIMLDNLEINKEEYYVMVSVNPKFYPVDVVMSAAYIFSERCYVLVDGDPVDEIIVKLIPKEKGADVEKLGREFNNELVDYANHIISSIKNAKLREAILNRVLLTNSLEKEELKDLSVLEEAKPWTLDDSEAVAKPWEEKYGKN